MLPSSQEIKKHLRDQKRGKKETGKSQRKGGTVQKATSGDRKKAAGDISRQLLQTDHTKFKPEQMSIKESAALSSSSFARALL
jgi:hypothetical protein